MFELINIYISTHLFYFYCLLRFKIQQIFDLREGKKKVTLSQQFDAVVWGNRDFCFVDLHVHINANVSWPDQVYVIIIDPR